MTKSYKELGLNIEEIGQAYRPVVERAYKIGRMGGKVKWVDFYQGDYASWFEKQEKRLQDRVIGPNRGELVRSGAVDFKELVDRRTGRLLTLDELGFRDN